MDRMVGKLVLMSLFFVNMIQAAATLHITDIKGNPLDHVVVGYPFKIVLSLEGQSKQPKRIIIDELDKVQVDAQETRMQITNGRATFSSVYHARIDVPGSYT